jgi:hypothetical protein
MRPSACFILEVTQRILMKFDTEVKVFLGKSTLVVIGTSKVPTDELKSGFLLFIACYNMVYTY